MKTKTDALLKALLDEMPLANSPPDGWISKRDIQKAAEDRGDNIAFSTAKKKYLDLIKEGWIECEFKVDGHKTKYISPPK